MTKSPLILATGSQARIEMMQNAGVEIVSEVSRLDEAAVKSTMLAEGSPPRDIADALAELKAQKLSRKYPGAMVLGADQILVQDGKIFDKPESIEDARRQLCLLRNNQHQLISAAVIFEDDRAVFRHIGSVKLTMRSFTDGFLDEYLENEGSSVMETVGAYKIEGRGAQLFSRIEGDYFSILGLPLLEVLDYLRTRGIVTQ